MPLATEEQSPFWHDFQRPPAPMEEHHLNEIITNSDKTPDLGWVYTVIAGMLNILVIYDAVIGPAFPIAARTEETAGTSATAEGVAS